MLTDLNPNNGIVNNMVNLNNMQNENRNYNNDIMRNVLGMSCVK